MVIATEGWLVWLLGGVELVLSVLLARVARQALLKYLMRVNANRPFTWLGRWIFFIIVLLGALSALDTVGIHVSAIMAGLGITGIAVGLAAKDILSHAISALVLLLYRPIRIGNRIEVKGYAGVVHDITFSHVVLMDQDGQEPILVPNALFFKEPVRLLDQHEEGV